MNIWKMTIACSVAGAVMAGQMPAALAAPLPPAVKVSVSNDMTPVWYRGGWGWGLGAVAAGAIIGGAIASAPYGYYGGGPYYGYGYGYAPAYYGYPAYGYPRYYGYRPYRPYYGYRYGYYRPHRVYPRHYYRGYW